jgi:hypothetical protein
MAISHSLDPEILAAALAGLQQKAQHLDEQIAAVRSLMGQRRRGRPPKTEDTAAAATQPKKKRTLSAEAKKRIAEAQKKRWAAVRKAHQG